MKRRYIVVVIAGVLFLIALLLTVYPVISNLYNEQHQSVIQITYEEAVEQADNRELEQIRSNAIIYNQMILPGTSFAPEALMSAAAGYDLQLNMGGNGIMGYLSIPRISVELPIYHGTDADTLERGSGHLMGSSLPVGGESTHTIITGHSGLASQKMFTDLEQLKSGDVFYLRVLDEVLAYRVFHTEPVLPHDTSKLGIVEGKDYCTLITCYPTGVNTHRLLVQAERIPYEEAQETQMEATQLEEKTESNWELQYELGLWLGILIMLSGALIYTLGLLLCSRPQECRGGRYGK